MYVTTNNGLYESHDHGKTWTVVPTLAKMETYNLRVYNNVIYVETKCNGLYESRDNDKTFVQNKTINHAYLDYIYSDQNAIYVGTTKGLYQSTNNGKTFVQRFAS